MAFEVKAEAELDDKPKDTTPKKAAKAKAAAKGSTDSKPKQTGKRKRKPGPPDLEAKLNEFIAFAGVAVFPLNQPDGIILCARGESLAHAWAELAKVNPYVKNVLEKMVTGGVMGGVVIATLSVVVPIAQNHGVATNVPSPFGLTQDDVDKARSNETIDAMLTFQEEMAKSAPAAPSA